MTTKWPPKVEIYGNATIIFFWINITVKYILTCIYVFSIHDSISPINTTTRTKS